MIGIPFKMICNCNNSGGSGNTNPTPKQKFSANFGFVARIQPKTATGVVAHTQVLIKNISLDGEEKEVEIELPYGYAGLSSIKALYIMCDKLGVTATEDAQQFPTVHTNQTDMTKQTTLDNLYSIYNLGFNSVCFYFTFFSLKEHSQDTPTYQGREQG